MQRIYRSSITSKFIFMQRPRRPNIFVCIYGLPSLWSLLAFEHILHWFEWTNELKICFLNSPLAVQRSARYVFRDQKKLTKTNGVFGL